MAVVPDSDHRRPSRRIRLRDLVEAIGLGIACTIAFIVARTTGGVLDESDGSAEIGAMWAVAATVFVFRATVAEALSSTWTRLGATLLSLAVCLVYLLLLPVTAVGVGVVIGAGALLALLVGLPEDAALTGITSVVVLVVADLAPPDQRWLQPLLRLLDTAVGTAVGLLLASLLIGVLRRRRPER